MVDTIIEGNFPKGARINLLESGSIIISWLEGWKTKSYILNGQINRIEILKKKEGLTRLEGGIIGGSVAGLPGFIGGYLSLEGDENNIVFVCYLKDGRYFIAQTSPDTYNALLDIIS